MYLANGENVRWKWHPRVQERGHHQSRRGRKVEREGYQRYELKGNWVRQKFAHPNIKKCRRRLQLVVP